MFRPPNDPQQIRVIPIQFGTRKRPLYGVVHPAREPRRRQGVITLNPWGWEALRAHRTLRDLGQRLAVSGFDVLRFDYSCSGDSWGDRHDVSAAEWMEDGGLAADELAAMTGVRHISLVGLRLGGLFAARLASRLDAPVDRLVLWDAAGSADTLDEWVAGAPAGERRAFPVTDRFRRELHDLCADPPPPFPGAALLVGEDHGAADTHAARSVDRIKPPPGLAPCWVEDRDHGAGVVPVTLLESVVEWFHGS